MAIVGVWLYCLHRWTELVGPGRTARTFVFLCARLWRFYSGSIRCEVIISLSFPVPMPMVGVGCIDEQFRWPWTNRSYVCIPACLTLKVWFGFDTVWGRNPTFISCSNGDGRCLIILVASMNDLVASGRTDGTLVFLRVWLWRFYSGSIQCEVIISFSFPVTIYNNGDRWCLIILLASMNDLVGPGRTGRTFVFLCS